MFKKLIIGVLAVAIVVSAAVAIYIFSIIEKRPADIPAVTSVTYIADFAPAKAAADDWLKALYADNNTPSVSASVGIDGQVVWAGAIGYTDVKRRVPVQINSLYRIGSISKSLTAATVMRMVDKGQIQLDAPVNVYAEGFADGKATYTVRQLLSHQAGIRHYSHDISESFNAKAYADTRAAAAFVEHDPLLFEPGKGFHYSTYGYTILALAMEGAAHAPFEQIIEDDVLKPAGMASTRQDKAGQAAKKLKPYLLVGGALIEAPEDNVSHKYAGGGYVSTPSDLVRFGNALLDKNFLTAESRNALWTPVALKNGQINPEYYALGFRTGQDSVGRFVHHGGTANGGYAFLLIYPESGVVVALATNYTPMEAGFDRLAKAQQLAALFDR